MPSRRSKHKTKGRRTRAPRLIVKNPPRSFDAPVPAHEPCKCGITSGRKS